MNPTETMPEQSPLSLEEAQAMSAELDKLQKQVLAFANRLRGRVGVEQRWLAIGVTDVEKGVMSIGRAFLENPMKEAMKEIAALMGKDS